MEDVKEMQFMLSVKSYRRKCHFFKPDTEEQELPTPCSARAINKTL
jgi:hypothetical protein